VVVARLPAVVEAPCARPVLPEHNTRRGGENRRAGGWAAGGAVLTIALSYWRAALRRSWRQAVVLALVGGVLGAVALGALAGARRTSTAYGRYLASINASDVFVNVPGKLPGMTGTQPITLISSLPGIISHAAYVGLNGFPVVNGGAVSSFLIGSLNGSFDGEYFSQDRMTVLAGKIPPKDSTTTVVITPAVATTLHTGVGGTMRYEYRELGADGEPTGKQFTRSYRVAAIVTVPPALVDESDHVEGSILPPGATRQVMAEYFYAWIGLRLARGTAGIPELQANLARLTRQIQQQVEHATHQKLPGLSLSISRSDVIHHQVQQATRPEAVALTVFGAIAALAMLVLVGQGLTQMISRSAPEIQVFRALGATRAQAALVAGLPGVIPVLGGVILAVAGAVAVSPLAPVGPVRRYDPSRGVKADVLVLGPGALLLGVVLAGLLALLAVRAVRQSKPGAAVRSSAIARTAATAGLPASAVVGSRNALEPGSGVRSVPVRSTLLGSIAAVTAVVSAVVFNASLSGLISHPARYGWNWDLVIQAEGGYGSFTPGVMGRLIDGQPSVAGWSEFAFGQLPIDGRIVPTLGIRRHLGSVQPPTTTGHSVSGSDQIELGSATLGQLGKKVGDSVRIGIPPFARSVTVVGTVTLPSFGVGGADHVSLGRGAMLPEATLLAVTGAGDRPLSETQSVPVFPSAVAIDLAPGTTTAQRAQLVHHIVSANPDGAPGGSYELRLAWHSFAGSLGAVPVSVVPLLPVILGLAAIVVAGNLLALGPAAVAARTRPAAGLRAE
jgi:putative ABC transport system permease protein